jgi:hypothetical protein
MRLIGVAALAGIVVVAGFLLWKISDEEKIDRIVSAETRNPDWMNGRAPMLVLPQSESIPEVAEKALRSWDWSSKGTPYTIAKIENRVIDGDTYIVVLLKTDVGNRVLLLRYEGSGQGYWWSRVLSPK